MKLTFLSTSGRFAVCTLVLTGTAGAATVLTGTGAASNTTVPAAHGSNAVGTPDIALTWSATGGRVWQSYQNWPNGGAGGHVYQVDGPGWNGSLAYNVDFTPASSQVAVQILSFDLNDWTGASPATTTLNWSVTGPTSGTLASGSGVVVADGSVLSISPNVTGAGGEILRLTLTPTAGVGSYFAMDNLAFDQIAVPEPGSAALGVLALGAMAMRRRRA